MATKTPLNCKVLRYYTHLEGDIYKCNLCVPAKNFSGKKKSNLVAHVRNMHSDIFIGSDQSGEIMLQEERLSIIQSLSEIVSVNGRTFTHLLDSGLLRIMRKDLERLDNAGCGITLNRNFLEIKEYLKHMALEIQRMIGDEAKNRMLSLLIDIGSKNRLSILGIRIQFMNNDGIQNRTIGMIPLDASHTAIYIVQEVMKCLQIYDIDIIQVIAMVSDNASNMIAAAKQLDNHIRVECENDENIERNLPDFSSSTGQAEILNTVTDFQELELILADEDNYEQLFEEVIGELSKHTTNVTTIRCAAHSIQLCVRAALKKSDFDQFLNLSKYVVKKLHTQKYKYEIHKAEIDCISPHPSNDTRWDSDLQMVCLHNSNHLCSLQLINFFHSTNFIA